LAKILIGRPLPWCGDQIVVMSIAVKTTIMNGLDIDNGPPSNSNYHPKLYLLFFALFS